MALRPYMSEFAFIYVFLIAFALCIAMIFIVSLRDSKSRVVKEDPDFITTIYNNKKTMLSANFPSLSASAFFGIMAATPVVVTAVLWLFLPNKAAAAIIGAFSVVLPEFIVNLIVNSRKRKYEEKYVRALKALSSALRSGMSIQQSVQDVVNNEFIAPDLREAFRQIDSDIRVGISIDTAFHTFAEKADNDDARDVASAISMQADVGGSEGKVIEAIAINIEERMLTRKKIRSIFSATDVMTNIFEVMPLFVVVFMCIGMPEYVAPVFNNTFYTILFIGILLFSFAGTIPIRKKIRIAKGESSGK